MRANYSGSRYKSNQVDVHTCTENQAVAASYYLPHTLRQLETSCIFTLGMKPFEFQRGFPVQFTNANNLNLTKGRLFLWNTALYYFANFHL